MSDHITSPLLASYKDSDGTVRETDRFFDFSNREHIGRLDFILGPPALKYGETTVSDKHQLKGMIPYTFSGNPMTRDIAPSAHLKE